MWQSSHTPTQRHSMPASGLILPLNSGLIPPQGTAKGFRRRGLGESSWLEELGCSDFWADIAPICPSG